MSVEELTGEESLKITGTRAKFFLTFTVLDEESVKEVKEALTRTMNKLQEKKQAIDWLWWVERQKIVEIKNDPHRRYEITPI